MIWFAILILCWSAGEDVHPPNVDVISGFSHFSIIGGHRDEVGRIPCPTEDDPDAMCPVYDPPAGEMYYHADFELTGSHFEYACARNPGDVCYFRMLTAWDRAGNSTVMDPLTLEQGECPLLATSTEILSTNICIR